MHERAQEVGFEDAGHRVMVRHPAAGGVVGVVFCAAAAAVVGGGVQVVGPVVVVGEGRVGADVEGDIEGVGREKGLSLFLEGFVCQGLLACHFVGCSMEYEWYVWWKR